MKKSSDKLIKILIGVLVVLLVAIGVVNTCLFIKTRNLEEVKVQKDEGEQTDIDKESDSNEKEDSLKQGEPTILEGIAVDEEEDAEDDMTEDSEENQVAHLGDTGSVGDSSQGDEYPYDYTSPSFFSLQDCWKYAPVAKVSGVKSDGSVFRIAALGDYYVMQGGCTDGKYAYFLMENQKITDCILYKVDMSNWTVVKRSEPLGVDHGNGITYNPNTKQLMVAHCKNRTQEFSYINPETLTVTGSKSLGRNFYSITYNAKHNKYVIGIKGSTKFVIYDGNFNKLGEYTGIDPGLSYQNIFCDDDYIYITYTKRISNEYRNYDNAIMCYDWNGNYCGVYKVDCLEENEAMFCVGNQYYMSFFTGTEGTVRKLSFDKSLMN